MKEALSPIRPNEALPCGSRYRLAAGLSVKGLGVARFRTSGGGAGSASVLFGPGQNEALHSSGPPKGKRFGQPKQTGPR